VREVLIDVTRLVDRLMQGRLPTGVDRVSLAYVRHFAHHAAALIRFAGCWIVLSRADSERLFIALLTPPERFAWWVRWLVARNLARSGSPERLTGRLLLNTGHSGLDEADYAHRVRRYGLKPFFFVHDLIPLSHPEYCRAGEGDRHGRRMDTVLRVGEGVIVNSVVTRSDLENYARSARRPLPPSVVAPPAPGQLPPGDAQAPLGYPYFVVLGTIEPRKNHWLILHVWRELAERLKDATPRLVVIGQLGWECENVLDMLERCAALKPLVIRRSACTDAELATWLRHARALLFASFVEGFGIPLVEALSLGVPAITSDLPVFLEIAGDIPDYLDPIDGAGWQALVLEYARPDSPRRQAQLQRMHGYAAPNWNDHFALVEDFMDRLDVAAR
jgi:glycosyltransferase involved in cell wall biosynthesis